MQKITPFLWFDHEAEEAAKFYVDVFSKGGSNAKMGSVMRYDENAAKASGQPAGSVLTVAFELQGLSFTALNGGPALKMSGGVSFVIACDSQEEIDYFWEKLSEGGDPGQCGWINRDKFGMTWQVIPANLPELIAHPKAMQAMLGMTKLVIADLQQAAA